MKKLVILILSILFFGVSGFTQDSTKTKKLKPVKSFLRNDRHWTIEVPIWVPGFRGEFAYGDITVEAEDGQNPGVPDNPIEPPPPGEPPWGDGNILSRLFKSSSYLKFFFMSKVAYEKKILLVDTVMASGRSIVYAINALSEFKINDLKTAIVVDWPTSPYSYENISRPNINYCGAIVNKWPDFPWEH